MSQSSHRRMIDRGRKAGLNARDLYAALSARQPSADQPVGKADCNGFVAKVEEDGKRSYEAPSEK